MPWKYILKIRIDNRVVYKRDIDEKETFIQKNNGELSSINNITYEILTNAEVLKHGRKR